MFKTSCMFILLVSLHVIIFTRIFDATTEYVQVVTPSEDNFIKKEHSNEAVVNTTATILFNIENKVEEEKEEQEELNFVAPQSILNLRKYNVQRRPKPVKLINGFTFNHEFDQLTIRMHELYHVVDYFILVESTFTHFGKPKRLHFEENKSLYKQFLPKIIHVVVDRLPNVADLTWEHENSMRDYIGKMGIQQIPDLADDDLIIINDADEIMYADVLKFIKYHGGFQPHMAISYRWSYYGYFWQNPNPTLLNTICTISFLRIQLNNSTDRVRHSPISQFVIGSYSEPAGWHCSWCFPIPYWVYKLDGALKGDGVRWGDFDENKDIQKLKENRQIGKWFDGITHGKLVDVVQLGYAPKYVLDNLDTLGYLVNPDIPSPENITMLD